MKINRSGVVTVTAETIHIEEFEFEGKGSAPSVAIRWAIRRLRQSDPLGKPPKVVK